MKLSGTARLSASPERVWAALNDPAVLARTIPGCLALDAVGPDEYTMTVSAGVASIKGTYIGRVRLADKQAPTSYVLHASGSGGPGTVSAECRVRLDAEGEGTGLRYDADAVVGGVIAGVGQRVLSGVAKKMAGQFFGNVDAELQAPASVTLTEESDRPGWTVGYLNEDEARLEPPPDHRTPPVDVRPLLVAGAVGAAIALLGVMVGSTLNRRK